MTTEQIIQSVITRLDENHAKLRAIVAQPTYTNSDNPDIRRLFEERARLFKQAQNLKAIACEHQ